MCSTITPDGVLSHVPLLLLALVAVQVTLGALTVLSGRQHIINSLHVVTGASVLATSLVLTLRAHRVRFSMDAGVSSRVSPSGGNATRPSSLTPRETRARA